MNRWVTVVILVLLVLVAAMGLRNAIAGNNPDPIIVANGIGPVPPVPWKNGIGPVPPVPWKNGIGPVPPVPWKR